MPRLWLSGKRRGFMKRFNGTLSVTIALNAQSKSEAKTMLENLIKAIENAPTHLSHGVVARGTVVKIDELKF